MAEEFRATRPDAQIMLAHVAEPSQFGVAELDKDGHVIGLEEKRASQERPGRARVYLFTAEVHRAIAASSHRSA